MKQILLNTIVCITFSTVGFSLFGGSYFSTKSKGIGIRQYNTGVRGMGMGFTGIASADSLQLNSFALTQWRYISTTRATIGISYQGISSDFDGGVETYNSTADFGGLNLAVPLVSKKWAIGLSITPYAEMDFKTNNSITSDGETFTQISSYTGNVSRAQFSLAWAPAQNFGISANYSYFFGSLNDQYDFNFVDNSFRDTSHKITYRFSGPGFGIGADWQPISRARIAGFVDFQPSVDLAVSYTSTLQISDDEDRNFDSFPLQFGIGSAFDLGKGWNAAIDYTSQNWADALTVPNADFDTWQLFGVGIEREAKRERKAGFFGGNDLRAGFSAAKLGYKFNGNTVSEYALHLGMGFPFGFYTNRFDVAFVGGFRGDLTKNLAEERFIKMNISLSIGEQWFQRIR